MQAARGVRSHFNIATPLDSAIFTAMGGLVVLVWLAMLTIAVSTTRRPASDPLIRPVTVAGSWLVLLGASVGFVMVAAGGHTVGGPDGGPGLPLLGWSTVAGDLRPAHFVGLHGLQILIVVSWAATRTTSPMAAPAAVRAAAVAAGVLTIALTGQALVAQPVTSVSTLLVAGVTLAAAAASTASTRPHGRPRPALSQGRP